LYYNVCRVPSIIVTFLSAIVFQNKDRPHQHQKTDLKYRTIHLHKTILDEHGDIGLAHKTSFPINLLSFRNIPSNSLHRALQFSVNQDMQWSEGKQVNCATQNPPSKQQQSPISWHNHRSFIVVSLIQLLLTGEFIIYWW
jgi:hypothetical protein